MVKSLISATECIRKRFGGLQWQKAVDFGREGNLAAASDLIFHYYDKTYTYDFEKRGGCIYKVNVSGLSNIELKPKIFQRNPVS